MARRYQAVIVGPEKGGRVYPRTRKSTLFATVEAALNALKRAGRKLTQDHQGRVYDVGDLNADGQGTLVTTIGL